MQLMTLLINKIKGLVNKLPLYDLSKTEFEGRTGITEIFLSEAENIDILDLFHIRLREGYTKKLTGNIHSVWSDGSICLFRSGEYLKRMYPDYTSETLRFGLTTQGITMSYLSLLGRVFYSDGLQNGIIENGLSRNWDAGTKRNIIKIGSNANVGGVLLSQFPVCLNLEFYNGRIFGSRDNVIWYTEPFQYEFCDLESNYIIMDSEVTMLASVVDGLWVSTRSKVYFLKADNPPFKFIEKSGHGAIRGTSQKIEGKFIGNGVSDIVVMWATSDGIYYGDSGGKTENVNDLYSFPVTTEGASIFKQRRGINQMILSLKNPSASENVYQ